MYDTVVLLGCGAVGRSVLIYWNKVIPTIRYNHMIIIEPRTIPLTFPGNVKQLKVAITRDNYLSILNSTRADIIIDLSIGIESLAIINYCQDNNIPYINTAQEDWDGFPKWDLSKDMYRHSLLLRQRNIIVNNTRQSNHPTTVLDHGMNPGLISHFVKLAIEDIARREGISYESMGEAAAKLRIETIHISEIDTQTSNRIFPDDTFVNTWSALGFVEEATDPLQIGWGSHEEEPLFEGVIYDEEQRFIPIRGMNIIMESYEPTRGKYEGYCIPHGEASTIPKYLTYGDYRPSAYYVYSPSIVAQKSINILRDRDYVTPEKYYILDSTDIISGYDSVGAFIIRGNNKDNYWAGTILDNENIPIGANATCVQVACSVLAAVDYIYNNPNNGIVFPEELDSHRILEIVKPFLGTIYMDYVDYKCSSKFNDLIVKVL